MIKKRKDRFTYKDVAKRYIAMLPEGTKAVNHADTDPFCDEHLMWMLHQIRKNSTHSSTKMHRWLGFVQGVLCMRGVTSVNVEREATRNIFNGE